MTVGVNLKFGIYTIALEASMAFHGVHNMALLFLTDVDGIMPEFQANLDQASVDPYRKRMGTSLKTVCKQGYNVEVLAYLIIG